MYSIGRWLPRADILIYDNCGLIKVQPQHTYMSNDVIEKKREKITMYT